MASSDSNFDLQSLPFPESLSPGVATYQNRGQLLERVPLANRTTWRVGGMAQCLYQPADVADLVNFIRRLPNQEPIFWLGLGSNLLIRDGGISGTVIATQGRLMGLTQVATHLIRAEAGVSCAQLARFCARAGLTGGEFWAGIPGTVGGALAMNAGCDGGETWGQVVALDCLNREGRLIRRQPNEFEVAYRQVRGQPDEWFVAAYFRLSPGDKEAALATIRRLLQRRAATQPTSEPNCGSVFRNPPGDYAARLIEASGLKGRQIGGAAVSTKHANFIVNTGSATANDIENLIELVGNEVLQHQGICLQREVHIVGNKLTSSSAITTG